MHVATFFYIAMPILGTISILIAIRAIYFNKRATQSLNEQNFRKDYNYIVFTRKPKKISIERDGELNEESKSYFLEFWNLQFDQWYSAQRNLIDTKIFLVWMQYRRSERANLSQEKEEVFNAGLAHYEARFGKNPTTKKFIDFVNRILNSKDSIEQIFNKHKI